jgi:hypothetical protein
MSQCYHPIMCEVWEISIDHVLNDCDDRMSFFVRPVETFRYKCDGSVEISQSDSRSGAYVGKRK